MYEMLLTRLPWNLCFTFTHGCYAWSRHSMDEFNPCTSETVSAKQWLTSWIYLEDLKANTFVIIEDQVLWHAL